MKRALSSALVLGSLLALVAGPAGCNNDKGSGGGSAHSADGTTAVVDLDRVARDLGWMTKMQANLETYRGQLQADLKRFEGLYQADITAKIKDMLPPGVKENEKVTLTPVQSQNLSNLVMAGRQQIAGLSQRADQQFNAYRINWIKQYREALSPIIRQVAEEKKMNIVIMQGENVLFSDRSVDLTDAVVDAARGKPPALTDVPMTKLDGPPTIDTRAIPQAPETQPTQPTTQP